MPKLTNQSPGVFTSVCQVQKITDLSRTMLGFGKTFDLAVEVELSVPELSWNPKFTVYGDFKRDGQQTIVGWGGAFKVRDFIKVLTGKDMEIDTDNPVIDPNLLNECLGKSFMRLSYKAGLKDDGVTTKYNDWNTVAPPDTDSDHFKARFFANYKKTGHPKNFNPDPGTIPDDSNPIA